MQKGKNNGLKGGYNRKASHIHNRTPEGKMEKYERKEKRRCHIMDPNFYSLMTGSWNYPIVCSKCKRFFGYGSSKIPKKDHRIDLLPICPECSPEFNSDESKAEFIKNLVPSFNA